MTRRSLLRAAVGATAVLAIGRRWSLADSSTGTTGVGGVVGTALAPGKHPSGAPIPFTGLALVLLPRSPSLLDGLERLRRQSRDSLATTGAMMPPSL